MISMIDELSVYVIGSHLMPSFLYASSSARKTLSRKNFWSFSLVKLMQSCSNELTSKISKPKTSSSPM